VGEVARATAARGMDLVVISTNEVFDGTRTDGRGYAPGDERGPINPYGAAKAEAERLAIAAYEAGGARGRLGIVRTSWLYSTGEGANFPTRLLAQLRGSSAPVKVVTDVIGNPTPAPFLALSLAQVMMEGLTAGTYHVCCTGAASKHEWARQIALSAGFDPGRIVATTSDQYVTIAARPRHVDLDTEKFERAGLIALPRWQDAWAASWASQDD